MIYILMIGLLGAVLMFCGDMLLYYSPKDFTYKASDSQKEKMKAIIDVMKKEPAWRVILGGMIGPIAAFLYCVGFYHIVLITNDTYKVVAIGAFLFSCFGIIVGGAYHSHWPYLGLLGDEKYSEALEMIMQYFQKLTVILYVAEAIGFVLLLGLIITGNTVLPVWLFIFSPGILFLLVPVVNRLPKGLRVIVAGGWTNLISVIYYIAVIISIY